MTALQITHQRIDDIPLLLAIMIEMGIPQQIDCQIKPHGHWQGISVGTVITIWLCYILTEHDHRLLAVREWVNERRELFDRLLGIQLRDTDLTDDRLAICLTLLGDSNHQTALDEALVQSWITLYELPTATTRHDSTTVSVYQDIDEEEETDSILGYGHSKDHRPDLKQFKVMLSTLDTVIVSGFCSEYCVLSTYRGAEDNDLRTYILKGSSASSKLENIQFVESISDTISLADLRKELMQLHEGIVHF